jgi:hypothetical protein
MHSSSNTTVVLSSHSKSIPIIEKCKSIRFGALASAEVEPLRVEDFDAPAGDAARHWTALDENDTESFMQQLLSLPAGPMNTSEIRGCLECFGIPLGA